MTGINMKLPPPTVTGVNLPGALEINNSPTKNYDQLVAIRKQAQDEITLENKKFAKKSKHKTPLGIKVLGGISLLTALAWGVKKLLKK